MNLFFRLFSSLAAVFLSSCELNNPQEMDSDLWFIYNQILENHPGVNNTEDPNFVDNLKVNFEKSLKEISLLNLSTNNHLLNLKDTKEILQNFIKSLNDNHLYIHWHEPENKKSSEITEKNFSINNFDEETVIITIPTFTMSKEQENDFKKILNSLQNYKNKKYLIIDIRGNSGGNSSHGSEFINSLFGKNAAEQNRKKMYEGVSVDWKISKENLEHVKKYNELWPAEVVNGMQKCLLSNQTYYRENYNNYYKIEETAKKIKSELKAKIFVLIDGRNISAALDFIDELKSIYKDLKLIGEPTNQDNMYMEIRGIDLQSKMGKLYFPIKVYRGRKSGNYRKYYPNIHINFLEKNISQIIQKIKGR